MMPTTPALIRLAMTAGFFLFAICLLWCFTQPQDDQGNPIATGEGGCKGFVKWLALYEPKTAAALLARVLPYFIGVSEVPEVASEAEIEAQFKELGLPLGLIEHLQIAPARP
jgi:hypothetical protein